MTAPTAATVLDLEARYPQLPIADWARTISRLDGIRNADALLVSCCKRGQPPHNPVPIVIGKTYKHETVVRARPEYEAFRLDVLRLVSDGAGPHQVADLLEHVRPTMPEIQASEIADLSARCAECWRPACDCKHASDPNADIPF